MIETMNYRIEIIGNRGYGIDYGCCNIFSKFTIIDCTLETLGKQLYSILNYPEFEDYTVKVYRI